jgi:hypothetical protein
LLEQLGNPSDELVISDVIALAELRWRADQLRRDPSASALDVVRIEGLVDRRTRKLGLDRRGKREPDADPGLGQLLVDEHAAQGRGDGRPGIAPNEVAATPTRMGDETQHRGEAIGDEPEDGGGGT